MLRPTEIIAKMHQDTSLTGGRAVVPIIAMFIMQGQPVFSDGANSQTGHEQKTTNKNLCACTCVLTTLMSNLLENMLTITLGHMALRYVVSLHCRNGDLVFDQSPSDIFKDFMTILWRC